MMSRSYKYDQAQHSNIHLLYFKVQEHVLQMPVKVGALVTAYSAVQSLFY